MSNAAETKLLLRTTFFSVIENWCKRSCLAQHPAKVRSVSKSIFAMPVIEDTIFLIIAFATAKPAISRRFATFQRCSTLLSTALRSVRSVAVVACVCVLLHAVVVVVRVLRAVVPYYAPRLA